MEKHAGKIRQIAISSIRVAERIRKENGSLDELAQDIQKHGLLNPITVMEQADGGYVLMSVDESGENLTLEYYDAEGNLTQTKQCTRA